MRILIADDTPRKYERLVERLLRRGFAREDIRIVTSADAALTALADDRYELLVIDILLPRREEEEPDSQHSIDLVTEIVESDGINRPSHIVGITADIERAAPAVDTFSGHLWTVIHYLESTDEWLNQVVNCATYVQELSSRPVRDTYGVDLAIICALRDPELDAVLKLPWDFKAARPVDEHLFVHDGVVPVGDRSLSVVAVSCERMGMVSAALTTSRLIRTLRPRAVVMTGICAGIQGKARIGDAIFIDPSWDWQSGKYIREAEDLPRFLISPHQVGPTPAARAFAEQLKQDRELLSRIGNEGPDEPPNVLRLLIGPVASGSAVVADEGVTSEIRLQNRDTTGVEMEGYGFFVAAAGSSGPKPIALAIKAVCDLADSLKNDKYQRYASYVSAQLMRHYIERYGPALLGINRR